MLQGSQVPEKVFLIFIHLKGTEKNLLLQVS